MVKTLGEMVHWRWTSLPWQHSCPFCLVNA